MRIWILLLALIVGPSAWAIEGPTAAGPIGGTDIRSAVLPPAGLYGGLLGLGAATTGFVDGHGHPIPALADGTLAKEVAGPFLLYVPEIKVGGGSVGIGTVLPIANYSGHLFEGESNQSTAGLGDPYVEISWSRSFGSMRPSKYQGTYPILEGLSVLLAVGVVIPVGQYDASTPLKQAISPGTNIWDVAPSIAATYTTAPILLEGTEFSAKLFWNHYYQNPETTYLSGDVLNIDFAITEHIGRFQFGVAGFYAVQIEDDRRGGVAVAGDGNRGELLQVGGVLNYDIPEQASAIKLKALNTLMARNTVEAWNVVAGWAKKF